MEKALAADGRRMHRAKDQAIFEKDEVLTQAGRPFTVYTPYRNAWLKLLEDFYVRAYPALDRAWRNADTKLASSHL